MKKIIYILFLFFFGSEIKAQFPSADTAYFYLFGNKQVEEFRSVANVSADSGYIAVGTASSFTSGESDIYLVKTDWKCKTLWSRSIGSSNIEKGYAVKETYDGGFIIGGFTNNNTGTGDYDMLLVKTDQEGFIQWAKNFGGTDWDFMYSLAIAPDSGFILCGSSYSFGNGSSDVYVVRTDKDGNLIWQKSWGGNGEDAGNHVIITSDTNIVVGGYVETAGTAKKDVYLLKCDMKGDTIFTRSYGVANYNDECYKLIEHNTFIDSGYYMVGYSESYSAAHDKDILLLKFNQQGNFLWKNTFGSAGGEDAATCIQPLGFNTFVSGYTANGAGQGDVAAGVASFGGGWDWSQSASYGSYNVDKIWANSITLRGHFLFAGYTESFNSANGNAMLILCDSIKGGQYQKIATSSDSLVGINSSPVLNYRIYPVPAAEQFFILFPGLVQKGEIQLYNVTGEMVLEKKVDGVSKCEVNTEGLCEGIYFLRIITAGNTTTDKIIISR